jgi:ubiquinone/menaquinone biosynthesis C-methylase UbiE
MNLKTVQWLNPAHPNYERWRRGRESSEKRAALVMKLISMEAGTSGRNILDLGSGEGGTSFYFSKENNVVSFDLSILRLKRQQQSGKPSHSLVNGNAVQLPFSDSSFDLIILQDVIEHVDDRISLVKELKRVLTGNGMIYLSTPNKFSVINLIADPHWGIPLLALFKRPFIKRYFLKYFRKDELFRNDIAQLLSLEEMKTLFNGFKINLKTKEVVDIIQVSPEGILWSDFHMFLYRLLKYTGAISILKNAASNKDGIINNYFTPAFYAVLQKDTR